MPLDLIAVWFLWAALAYVVVLHAAVLRGFRKSPDEARGATEIKTWLWCLLNNGYDGETVVFRDQGRRRFIRFEKYTDDAGRHGLDLTFPGIGWGKDLLPRLRAWAREHGLDFAPPTEGGSAWARVRLGDDLDQSLALYRAIWTGFYNFSENEPGLLQVGNLGDIVELVDGTVPSEEEGRRRTLRYFNARLGHIGIRWLQARTLADLATAVGFLVLPGFVGFWVAAVGLPVSTLLDLGRPPGWRFELGPILLHGSGTSLGFLVVYLLSGAILWQFMRFMTINRRSMARAERLIHAPKRAVFAAVPIAVLLLWLQC